MTDPNLEFVEKRLKQINAGPADDATFAALALVADQLTRLERDYEICGKEYWYAEGQVEKLEAERGRLTAIVEMRGKQLEISRGECDRLADRLTRLKTLLREAHTRLMVSEGDAGYENANIELALRIAAAVPVDEGAK